MNHADLAAIFRSQGIPVDAWTAQQEQEERFERDLRAYILNAGRRFRYGGLVNLMTTLATMCEQEAANTGRDDFAKAADEFKRLESELDHA